MGVFRAASWAAVVAILCSMMVVGASTTASAASTPASVAGALVSPGDTSRTPGTMRGPVKGAHQHGRRDNVARFVDPGTILLGKKFGAWLLDKAGGAAASQGFGMILSLSGLNSLFAPDPNAALLREIQQQLTLIQNDIRGLRTSLNDLILQLNRDNLDRLLIHLRDSVTTPLDHLFREEFARVVRAAEAYADAREHNPLRITPTYDALMSRRNEFYVAFDACCKAATTQIHHFLVPGPGSVLAAMGRVLAGEQRYLTAEASADLRNLYDQFADWEALAAWMKMERLLPSADPSRVPSGVFPGDLVDYNQARRDFLGYRRAEAQNLVLVIPTNVVIDGSTADSTTSLTGARMWVPAATGLTYQPGIDRGGSVPRAVGDLNARHAEGLDDWRAPSQPELTTLLAGKPAQPPTTSDDFLRSLNPTSLPWGGIVKESWPFLWSSSEVTQQFGCYEFRNGRPFFNSSYPVRTQTAVSTTTTTPTWSGRPRLPVRSGPEPIRPTDPSVCTIFVPPLFASTTGALLAARTIGAMPIDYLARGGGPTLRPSASLRNTDLSGLDLTGIDLTDADLTGATLTDAYFTDDDGAAGVNLTRARLSGVTSGGIVGDATLPSGWHLTHGYLVGPSANLTGADLIGADLSGTDLRGVTSGGVDCTGCKLPLGWRWTGLESGGFLVGPGADLRGADLSGLDLSGLDLTGAELLGANLSHANLSRAVLSGINLTRVEFRGSNLTGAEISRSNISGADLTGATLTGVRGYSLLDHLAPVILPARWTFRAGFLFGPGANLSGLTFSDLDLTMLTLTGADLSRANLSSSRLTGANLTGANLTGANLTGATLANATLVNARLTGATVTGATFTTDSDSTFAGIVSGGLVGTPLALPVSGRYRVVQGYLVGPSANLAGATFTAGAQLGVSLSATNFTGASLTGVNLTSATLRNAILSGARLTNVTLSGADMRNATLDEVWTHRIVGAPTLPGFWSTVRGHLVGPRADLSGADLSTAQFAFMDLRAANLSYATLTGASLAGTNLEGADLTGAVLTGVQWAATNCPDGVRTQTAPCPSVVWRGSSTVRASADPSQGKLLVDVGPGLTGSAQWRVTVQAVSESGGWVTVSTHNTRGPGDTLRIDLPQGTYRAFVWPQHRYLASTSTAVALAR